MYKVFTKWHVFFQLSHFVNACVEKNTNGLYLVKYKIYQIQLKYIHLEVEPWYNCKGSSRVQPFLLEYIYLQSH